MPITAEKLTSKGRLIQVNQNLYVLIPKGTEANHGYVKFRVLSDWWADSFEKDKFKNTSVLSGNQDLSNELRKSVINKYGKRSIVGNEICFSVILPENTTLRSCYPYLSNEASWITRSPSSLSGKKLNYEEMKLGRLFIVEGADTKLIRDYIKNWPFVEEIVEFGPVKSMTIEEYKLANKK